MTKLDRQVLVLNRNWQPVQITDAFQAVCKLYQAKADVVDRDFALYAFEDWVETWSDATRLAQLEAGRVVACARFQLVLPEVIRLKGYSGYHRSTVRFSRRNIFDRDDHTCQYCGRRRPARELNIDHVVPRSRGGQSTWTNVVIACIGCNQFKADRTPREAGMTLLREPRAPRAEQFAVHQVGPVPRSWEDFLGKMYWHAELET